MGVAAKIKQSMAEGSWIRRMFEEGAALRQRYGADNVFDLSIGNPVVEPPEEFSRALKAFAESRETGRHRYMPNAGYPGTRDAVARQLEQDFGLPFTRHEVVMTCGAAGALNVALKTILNPGDEVVLLAPYFVEYGNYIDNHGGVVKVVPTDEQFLPRLDALAAAIGPRTRALIINSPNNPTGVVYPAGLLRGMADLLRSKGTKQGSEIYLISDEPYRRIIYDGLNYPSPLPHYAATIVVNSHSKDLALPGERIGYLAVHPECPGREELVNGFIFCNRTLGFVNAPALMQHLVRRLQSITVSVADYQRKRDFLYEHLVKAGYKLIRPQGAFYLFPQSPTPDDVAFVRELQEYRVLAVPGRGFGMAGHFRISYCVDDRTLEGALDGLRKVAQKYRPG